MKKRIVFSLFFAPLMFSISHHTCTMELSYWEEQEIINRELEFRNTELEQQLSELIERYERFFLTKNEKIKQLNEQLKQKTDQQGAHIPLSPAQPELPLYITLIWLCQDHLLAMNSLPVTISSLIMYELLSRKKRLRKSLSVGFKKNCTRALRGGLYASLANVLLETSLQCRSVNGWKVIGGYFLIDLISKYSWHTIKKMTSKSYHKIQAPPESKSNQQQPSRLKKVAALFGWGIKTCLSEAMVRALTPEQPLQMTSF